MHLEDLETPLEKLKGVGSRTAEKFSKNNIKTIKDLLYFFPYKYEDLRQVTKIKDAKIGEKIVIWGRIKNIKVFSSPKKKFILVQGLIEDETGTLRVIWYNQAYLAKLFSGAPQILAYGKLIKNKYGLHLSNPEFKILPPHSKFRAEIIPIYKEISNLPTSFIRRLVENIFKKFPIEKLSDPLPDFIKIKLNLPDLGIALKNMHFPKDFKDIKDARRRFLFEQLFYIQLKLSQEKVFLTSTKSPLINYDKNLINEFLEKVNIKLTNAQEEVLKEIVEDLQKIYPMNRLLQGETGSGKTLIAEIVSLLVVNSGYSVIMMAPTEILAYQHFQRFLEDFVHLDYGIGLIVKNGGYYGFHGFKAFKNRETLLRLINSKKINIIIGTHALIEAKIQYKDIGLIIIDEQQRFGVEQRKKLLQKSSQDYLPHLLSITATPIPRTLALAFYGDLDISILKEKPPGRKEVKTYVVDKEQIHEVWAFLKKELAKGHQAFIICPRIETQKDPRYEIKTVVEEYEKIKKLFPNYQVAMLHGKMKSTEKEMIMKKMQNNEIQILVSSSVVEVGIDLPLATVIVVEGAERFGLSQLHQLRGRVGRSIHESYCFLIPQIYTLLAYKRLKILEESQDAFYIAEKDLEIRGPGEFLGEKQSGLPDIAMEALKNIDLVHLAQKLAGEFIQQNPQLIGYPLLRKEVSKIGEILLS